MKKLLISMMVISIILINGIALAQFKPGEKYTKENAEKIKGLLPDSVAKWVKEGYITIQTGNVEYPFKGPKQFQQASAANEGKFSVDKGGNLIDKSGKHPDFLSGLPFPKIDQSDPQAGVKIMWNFYFQQFWLSSTRYTYDITWVSMKEFERKFGGAWERLFYTGRHDGPIPNPDRVDFKDMISVGYPYDVAGIATLLWRNKSTQDQLWSYAPALRRIRQLSPSNSSDAFLGSDISNDDALGFRGKIQTFNWKLIGTQKILAPFAGNKPTPLTYSKAYKGWTTDKNSPYIKYGYDYKDWKGAAWAPMNVIWDLRPVYVLEGMPKDPYYNFGRTTIYLDQESYSVYCKVVDDRAGTYWKTLLMGFNWVYAPGKEDVLSNWIVLFHIVYDSKSMHATVTHTGVDNPPTVFASESMKNNDFAMNSLLKFGK